MALKRQRKKLGPAKMLHEIQPDSAGIDVGAMEIYIALPDDHRSPDTVRCFGTFTRELHEAARWLQAYNIKSIAMESTGVYWIPIFQILEAYGFDIVLGNARHVKNVPGRKTDVQDCQWLQYLHSVGLLRGSYRPSHDVCSNSHFAPKRAILTGIEGFLGSIGGCVTHSCSAFSARRSQATCFWGPQGSFRAH